MGNYNKKLISMITNECKMQINKNDIVGDKISDIRLYHESDLNYETVSRIVTSLVEEGKISSDIVENIFGVNCEITKDIVQVSYDSVFWIGQIIEKEIIKNPKRYMDLMCHGEIVENKDSFFHRVLKTFKKKEKKICTEDITEITCDENSIKYLFEKYIEFQIKNGKFDELRGGRLPYSEKIYKEDAAWIAVILTHDCFGADYNLIKAETSFNQIQDIIQCFNMLIRSENQKLDSSIDIKNVLFALQSDLHNKKITNYRSIDMLNLGANAFDKKGRIESKLMLGQYVDGAMEEINKSVGQLIECKENIKTEEYIAEATKIMYRFLRIHPFKDGNGRTSRALFNILLNEHPKLTSVVFSKLEKLQYGNQLQKVDTNIYEKLGENQYLDYLRNTDDNEQIHNIEKEAIGELTLYMADIIVKGEQNAQETKENKDGLDKAKEILQIYDDPVILKGDTYTQLTEVYEENGSLLCVN